MAFHQHPLVGEAGVLAVAVQGLLYGLPQLPNGIPLCGAAPESQLADVTPDGGVGPAGEAGDGAGGDGKAAASLVRKSFLLLPQQQQQAQQSFSERLRKVCHRLYL